MAAQDPVAGARSLKVGTEGRRKHDVLAVRPLLLLPGGQRVGEAEHEESRAEEQGTAQQEAEPPGPDPARVVGSDGQDTCGGRRGGGWWESTGCRSRRPEEAQPASGLTGVDEDGVHVVLCAHGAQDEAAGRSKHQRGKEDSCAHTHTCTRVTTFISLQQGWAII